jgi:hypothetical protein
MTAWTWSFAVQQLVVLALWVGVIWMARETFKELREEMERDG